MMEINNLKEVEPDKITLPDEVCDALVDISKVVNKNFVPDKITIPDEVIAALVDLSKVVKKNIVGKSFEVV